MKTVCQSLTKWCSHLPASNFYGPELVIWPIPLVKYPDASLLWTGEEERQTRHVDMVDYLSNLRIIHEYQRLKSTSTGDNFLVSNFIALIVFYEVRSGLLPYLSTHVLVPETSQKSTAFLLSAPSVIPTTGLLWA